jgi:hypothetical protein
MQPHAHEWWDETDRTNRLWGIFLAALLGLVGWLLVGLAVLGIVGLLGVFAV